jgi:hypothetical protein
LALRWIITISGDNPVADGFWIARRGMLALSLPITDDDCDGFIAAIDKAAIDKFVTCRGNLLIRTEG